MSRVVTLKVDEALLEQVDEAARLLGWSRSELIRRAVMKYIKEHVPEALVALQRRHSRVQVRVVWVG